MDTYNKACARAYEVPNGNELYMNDRDEYNRQHAALYQQFCDDLFAEYGVQDNPKKEKCFSIAWSHGHSAGYSEVALYFEELVELIV